MPFKLPFEFEPNMDLEDQIAAARAYTYLPHWLKMLVDQGDYTAEQALEIHHATPAYDDYDMLGMPGDPSDYGDS